MSRVRVFQVITRMIHGGAQRVVLQLLEGLPRDGFEQTLVCGAGEGNTLLPRARAAGARVVEVGSLVREVRPARDARALLELGALFGRGGPDVVHAHTYKAGVVASVAARACGVPAVVFTPHGHIFARDARIPGVPAGAKLEVLRWVTRAAQACAHRVTALSEADLREQLALRLSPASKYEVIRNGIDVGRFAPPAGPMPREGSPVVGAVGRFSAEKGHAVLVEAFAIARRRLPRARLVLVGWGELEGALRAQAARLGLDGAAVFAGERESSEMLPGFDLFVQPSLYESQGMAILEAMAAGRPVVATDVGGVRDVVQDGETGVLVRPSDPAALADALVGLAEAPERAAAMAARARARVAALYSSRTMVDAYAALYRRLLGR